ncbi:M15 family metallopeptidase [Isoptericola sp. b441]|uniref:M15 family metallopeptidase n=1 Tax=Actinotalea lenta TaxID=3064654 RepID=A0ABT9DCI3_9CELL|nr:MULTISPECIES: M15 family metallopeptidase [unclassified Isoptericola]MDO8108618.1 M15 family metallopeptidase [Isoptericola sp. b441]MDO8120028.1 M15 family metallopeptidase [Isoptericola sp. b490]
MKPRPHTLARALVVGAIGGATIAVPMFGLTAPSAVGTPVVRATADAPSTAEILASAPQQTTPTSVLAPAATGLRDVDQVSRSLTRDPLPSCTGVVVETSGNGQIPAKDLCTLWDGVHMLRGDAAVALTELNSNFKAAFGRNLCLTDAYRTLAVQRRLAYTKPGLAAMPGTSNHGWGLAIDLCGSETGSSSAMAWLHKNGPAYGWDNPAWARPGGSGPHEPWHWEYVPGTTAMGTNYS